MRPSRSEPGAFVRVLALCGSALAILLLLECGLRLQAFYEDARRDAGLRAIEDRTPPPRDARVDLADIIQISRNPRLIYELIPNLSVKMGYRVSTNSVGFRSPEIAVEKPPATARIVGLGDSIMFGIGVRDRENFVSALAERLDRRTPGVRWEYVNTAVPGYNTAMEVEALRSKALRFAPDIVVVNFVGNDFDLPNFIRRRAKPLALDRLFLTGYLRNAGRPSTPSDRPVLRSAPRHDEDRFEFDPQAVPPEYRYMVGWEGYQRAMSELRELSLAHGFHVLVVGHPTIERQAKRLATKLGFSVAESIRNIRRYAKEHELEDLEGKEFWIEPDDPHPTVLVHGLIADAILAALEKRGVVAEVVRTVSSRPQPTRRAAPP